MTKINHEEYEVLKELDDKWKWIARDAKCNSLNVFSVKPIKVLFQWDYMDVGYKHTRLTKEENKMFHFVQWEDEEPYSIKELIEEYEYSALERHLNSFKELSKAIRTKESEETEVKKDKLWAKFKIREELESWWGVEGGIDEDGINYVLNIIDQLEDPEVLSKEWINEHITDGHNVSLGDKVVYADELDGLLVPKQESEVVPEVLSQEWIDKNVVHVRGLGDIVEAEAVEGLLVPNQEITYEDVLKVIAENIDTDEFSVGLNIEALNNNEKYEFLTDKWVEEYAQGDDERGLALCLVRRRKRNE